MATPVIVLNADNAVTNVNKPSEDVVISTDKNKAPLSKNAVVTAKTITTTNLAVQGAQLNFQASSDINLSGITSTGNFPKASGNGAILLNTNGNVAVKDSNLGQTGYNGIEIGYNKGVAPTNVTISNIDFSAKLDNLAIIVHSIKAGGVINIKDCHFASVSNAVRFSNRDNVSGVVINIENCTVDKWDSNPSYSGVFMCEDNYATSKEQCIKDNRYASNKVKVNFKDVKGPDGKVINPSDLNAVIATNQPTQIAYIYNDKEGAVTPYKGNESRFPTFSFVDSTAASGSNTGTSNTGNKDNPTNPDNPSGTDKKDDTNQNKPSGSDTGNKDKPSGDNTNPSTPSGNNGDNTNPTKPDTPSSSASDIEYKGINSSEWTPEKGFDVEAIAKDNLYVFNGADVDVSTPEKALKALEEYSVLRYMKRVPMEILLNDLVRKQQSANDATDTKSADTTNNTANS